MTDNPTPAPAPSRDAALSALARCRQQIEAVDRELIQLLAKRVGLSKEIGALKKVAGLPREREARATGPRGCRPTLIEIRENPIRSQSRTASAHTARPTTSPSSVS